MQRELQSNNNLSGISLFRIPWKARWEGSLQRSPPGGTGMFHYDSPGSSSVLRRKWSAPSSNQTNLFPIPAF